MRSIGCVQLRTTTSGLAAKFGSQVNFLRCLEIIGRNAEFGSQLNYLRSLGIISRAAEFVPCTRISLQFPALLRECEEQAPVTQNADKLKV